ncbi:MAG: TIGR03960 family B12-binding radical SAM protein [Planctomycetes bacterium]|nr:TIGR03960 family B12-binding radical SAM protein [Planctomycetota bacterium]
MMLWDRIERHLPFVQTPSQYIGAEWNSVRKGWNDVQVRVAVGFPDAYKIGMAHLGVQILYGLVNARPDALCERFFAPWPDLEERLRADGIPLFTVDGHRPVRDFDIVGFSLQSEMGYTNFINMMELAGIPLYAGERGERDPIVVGGGVNASYPEPVAEFFDVLILGDGEVAMAAMIDALQEVRRGGWSRNAYVKLCAEKVPGAYVPALYDFEWGADGRLTRIVARDGAPFPVKKAVVPSLEDAFYPVKPIVPYVEVVHDRINLEIMRGCRHRCKFCHAVNFKNKLRLRPVEHLVRQAETAYANTGYDEIALTSLSSGDYPWIHELMTRLNARFKARRVSVSLPSLRVDGKLRELPALMKTVRKSGFTVAPEAGSEELRKIIRKPIHDEDLLATARAAFQEGWNHVKLYFMIGLPAETEEDLRGIVETSKRISLIGKEVRGQAADVNVTISPFIPKPHTPFQFAGQKDFAYLQDVERRLAQVSRGSRVHLKMHDPRTSYVEAVLARGGRPVGKALIEAHKRGAKFDEWREFFDFERWMESFAAAGIDPDLYARREFAAEEPLPWDHLDVGVSRAHLWRDYQATWTMAKDRAEAKAAGLPWPRPGTPIGATGLPVVNP